MSIFIAIETLQNPSSDLPTWSIAVIGLIAGLLAVCLCYYLVRRRLSSKRTVNNIDQLEKHHTITNMDSSVTMDDTISKRTTQVYKPAMIEQEKLSLPLPPPSSSLFSDKMELNSDDAMQLFQQYMQSEKQTKGGLSALDLDMPQQLVNTVQQKMGTIKCNLRQSLRRQKSKARATPEDAAPLHHMFDPPTRNSVDAPQKSSMSELDRYTASGAPTTSSGTPSTINNEDAATPISGQFDRYKTLPSLDQEINGSGISSSSASSSLSPTPSPSPSPSPLPVSAPIKSPLLAPPIMPSPSSLSSSNSSSTPSAVATTSPSPVPTSIGNAAETSAIHAARYVIRSASRKSKTRSTLIGDDTALKMFSRNDMMPSPDLDESEKPDDLRSAYTALSGYTTVSGRSTKPGTSATRYLTNDILVRRASTLGRSHQAAQRRKPSLAHLNALFDAPTSTTTDSPSSSDKLMPANEKVEVTQVFDLAEQQRITNSPRPLDLQTDHSTPTAHVSQSPTGISYNRGKLGTHLTNSDEGTKAALDRTDSFDDRTTSTDPSRHSNTSVATMIRISQQQQSQTWSGRAPSNRASIPQDYQLPLENHPPFDNIEQRKTPTMSPISEKSGQSSPADFYTMRSGRSKQQRTGVPSWSKSFEDKTPAELERDGYLKTLHDTHGLPG
ncbi:hypothetical protein [Absidia glauca]|uniref:Uncharacterized protein n=1 Tax=Absidia glauca TaxID=4829 RepID=A0A168QYT1_ABSGL|nr:hypothetical protein [Absidia glauca]